MKRCPQCGREYDLSMAFCLDDGTELLYGPATAEPAPSIGERLEETPTAIFSGESSGDPATRPFIPQTTGEKVRASQSGAPYPSIGSPKSRTATVISIVVGAAILSAIGFAVYKYRGTPESGVRTMRVERVTTDGKSTATALSPDGKYAVYNIDEGGAQSLWTRHIATSSPVQIAAPADGVEYGSIRFTPDGNFVTFIKRDSTSSLFNLYQMPVLGGAQKKLAADVDGGATFSPDGTQIAFLRGNFPEMGESSIMIANADGTGERILAKRRRPETFPWWPVGTVAWSPDGKLIAAVIGGSASGSGAMEVAEVSVDDGSVKAITDHGWYEIFQVAWLPDQSGLLVIGADKASSFYTQQIYMVSYPGGERRRITTDFNMYRSLSLDADGKTLAVIQSNRLSDIWLVPNGDSSRAERIKAGGTNQDGTDGLALAPDGRIIFYSQASGADDIWIMNGDGSGVKQLTIDGGTNYDLKVTPDGRYIVFTSERAGQPNIWRMDIDGANPKRLTFGNSEYGASITPDSQWVFYDSTASGVPAIWKVPIDGGESIQVIRHVTENSEISPDGKLIACHFRAGGAGTWAQAIFSIEGGEPIKVLDRPLAFQSDFRWSPDGRALHYTMVNKGVANVWSKPIDGGPAKQVTNFKTDRLFNFKWSPDGKNMVAARGSVIADVVLMQDFR